MKCSHGVAEDTLCDDCDLIGKCWNFLEKQGCVLWGQYFEITDDGGREAAARWLAGVIAQVAQEPLPSASMWPDVRREKDIAPGCPGQAIKDWIDDSKDK